LELDGTLLGTTNLEIGTTFLALALADSIIAEGGKRAMFGLQLLPAEDGAVGRAMGIGSFVGIGSFIGRCKFSLAA